MASTDKVELVENEELPPDNDENDNTTMYDQSNGHVPRSELRTEEGTPGHVDSQLTVPVYTHKKSGPSIATNAVVIMNPIDGSCRIVSPDSEDNSSLRPIKERDMRFLKIFSVVAILFFFPSGIPALVYALKASKGFYEGNATGDLSATRKYMKFSERLIICSIVSGLLVFVLLFAILEKNALAEHSLHHGYSIHG